jgi:hypothetical protein
MSHSDESIFAMDASSLCITSSWSPFLLVMQPATASAHPAPMQPINFRRFMRWLTSCLLLLNKVGLCTHCRSLSQKLASSKAKGVDVAQSGF